MRTVTAYRAQDMPGSPVEPVAILIEYPFPSCPISIADDQHAIVAGELADALCSALPGGTLNRLTAELLRRAAGSLVVVRR